MGNNDENSYGDPSQDFLLRLEKSGFFKQIKDLEANLKTISADLKILGETTAKRLEETESLAAHVLAIESILAVMIKNSPINDEELNAVIKSKIASMSQGVESGAAVRNIAEYIFKEKK